MFKMIKFTKKDLEKDYMDNTGCPIFSAMERAGVPVNGVGGGSWFENSPSPLNRKEHRFSKKLMVVSTILSESMDFDSKRLAAFRKKLIGKSFKVAYLFLFLMVMGGCQVEGVFLDKAYRICRGHDGIQSINMDTREVACHDGLVKNFRTRSRG